MYSVMPTSSSFKTLVYLENKVAGSLDADACFSSLAAAPSSAFSSWSGFSSDLICCSSFVSSNLGFFAGVSSELSGSAVDLF